MRVFECRIADCYAGATDHVHCPCGLPMQRGERICRLCQEEDLDLETGARRHRLPSYRENRPWRDFLHWWATGESPTNVRPPVPEVRRAS